MARDRDYLEHIQRTAAAIARSAARGREYFFADDDAYDAALRRLQTIAESTQRLSDGVRMRHPAIPWVQIAGFRNRVVHAYLDVDPELVWSVITDDLPALAAMAERELGAS